MPKLKLNLKILFTVCALVNLTSSVTVTRQLGQADIFSISDCQQSTCIAYQAKAHDTCQCQCDRETPTYYESQQICIKKLTECQDVYLRDRIDQIVPVVLPLTGQTISPYVPLYRKADSAQNPLGQSSCTLTSAIHLTSEGWTKIGRPQSSIGFISYKSTDGNYYLRWQGSGELAAQVTGRLVRLTWSCTDLTDEQCMTIKITGTQDTTIMTTLTTEQLVLIISGIVAFVVLAIAIMICVCILQRRNQREKQKQANATLSKEGFVLRSPREYPTGSVGSAVAPPTGDKIQLINGADTFPRVKTTHEKKYYKKGEARANGRVTPDGQSIEGRTIYDVRHYYDSWHKMQNKFGSQYRAGVATVMRPEHHMALDNSTLSSEGQAANLTSTLFGGSPGSSPEHQKTGTVNQGFIPDDGIAVSIPTAQHKESDPGYKSAAVFQAPVNDVDDTTLEKVTSFAKDGTSVVTKYSKNHSTVEVSLDFPSNSSTLQSQDPAQRRQRQDRTPPPPVPLKSSLKTPSPDKDHVDTSLMQVQADVNSHGQVKVTADVHSTCQAEREEHRNASLRSNGHGKSWRDNSSSRVAAAVAQINNKSKKQNKHEKLARKDIPEDFSYDIPVTVIDLPDGDNQDGGNGDVTVSPIYGNPADAVPVTIIDLPDDQTSSIFNDSNWSYSQEADTRETPHQRENRDIRDHSDQSWRPTVLDYPWARNETKSFAADSRAGVKSRQRVMTSTPRRDVVSSPYEEVIVTPLPQRIEDHTSMEHKPDDTAAGHNSQSMLLTGQRSGNMEIEGGTLPPLNNLDSSSEGAAVEPPQLTNHQDFNIPSSNTPGIPPRGSPVPAKKRKPQKKSFFNFKSAGNKDKKGKHRKTGHGNSGSKFDPTHADRVRINSDPSPARSDESSWMNPSPVPNPADPVQVTRNGEVVDSSYSRVTGKNNLTADMLERYQSGVGISPQDMEREMTANRTPSSGKSSPGGSGIAKNLSFGAVEVIPNQNI